MPTSDKPRAQATAGSSPGEGAAKPPSATPPAPPQNAAPENAAPENAPPQNGAPQPSAPQAATPATPPASQPVGPRAPQYMIAPQASRGVQALSTDLVIEQLRNAPDIEYIRTIQPPRMLALQDVDGAAPASGPLVLARMAPDKAARLQAQAGARLVVERDRPLVFADAAPALPSLRNPGVVVPHADGFEAVIEVRAPDGRPLEGAEVYVFGSVWPAQAVTGADGRAAVSVPGESPDTVQALYVKPKLDHWSLWLPRPRLVPGGVANTVQVQPIPLPPQPMLGWGQRVMGLDRLPARYDGAGVRVAVIDSGAAQRTHRNLHHVGPGRDVVGDGGQDGWTQDRIGHGSHCAGIIAGTPGNGAFPGLRGFVPAAEVHVCRIFPGGRFSDLAAALDYCLENGVDVVNLSLGGGDPSRVIEDRLARAKAAGIACVVAAGNSGGPVQFPASIPHVLAVAALGRWGEFPDTSYHATQALDGFGPDRGGDGLFPAKFSCFGPEVGVCAPGVAIVSSLPDDGFAAWDGTSMATPHVTGLAALVLAHHPDFQGAFRARDARRVDRLFGILKETATPLGFGDAARTGAGLPYAPRALGIPDAMPAADATATAEIVRQVLEALARQAGTTPAPAQPQMAMAMAGTPAPAFALQSAGPQLPVSHTLQELRSAMLRARLL